MMGTDDSRSAKSGQWRRFAKRRMRVGRCGCEGGGGRRIRVRRRRDWVNGMWRIS